MKKKLSRHWSIPKGVKKGGGGAAGRARSDWLKKFAKTFTSIWDKIERERTFEWHIYNKTIKTDASSPIYQSRWTLKFKVKYGD